MAALYGSIDLHIILMGPKPTPQIGVMPFERNLVLNFTLDCFGCNSLTKALFEE
jgi:hypothetical protein